MKFSILIPNYGYSLCIFDCLKSVVSQITNDLFDYEIIMCDQSKNDDFVKIKEKIDNDYLNKVVLIHSDVKGLFRARHTLIQNATGEFVVFVDSDDIVENDYLLSLYKIIQKEKKPDIIVTSFCSCDNECEPLKHQLKYPDDINEHVMDYFLCTNLLNSVCFKPFRKRLYDFGDYNGFDFEVTNGEDFAFTYPLMLKAKKIVAHFEIKKYLYRFTSDSMVHKLSFDLCLKSLSSRLNYLTDTTLTPFQKSIMLSDRTVYLSSSMQIMLKRKTINRVQFNALIDCYLNIVKAYNLNDLSKLTKKQKIIYKLAIDNKTLLLWLMFYFIAMFR